MWKFLLIAAIAILQYLNAPHARAECPCGASAGYATPVRSFIASRPILSLIELRRERVEAGAAFMPFRTLYSATPIRSFLGACAEGRYQQVSQGQPWTPIRNFLGRRNR
ncbi:MAG TPA: hypothetical protein VKS79_21160 [Gemmataceae bacterium]|nr:hypothetical protein [Gemmataceae bacterium]